MSNKRKRYVRWNPVTGCTKISSGCLNCYASRLFPRVYPGRDFEDVKLHPDRLEQPLHWHKPKEQLFIVLMGDLFHDAVPALFINDVWSIMERCPQQVFRVLTRRPKRMADLLNSSPICDLTLPNVWIGVSIENSDYLWRADILRKIPNVNRFLDLEPLIGNVGCLDLDGIGWVMAGGECADNARLMQVAWAQTIRDQCIAEDVPFFFNRHGSWCREDQLPVETENYLSRIPKCPSVDRADGTYWFLSPRRAGRELDGRTWDEVPELGRAKVKPGRVTKKGEDD